MRRIIVVSVIVLVVLLCGGGLYFRRKQEEESKIEAKRDRWVRAMGEAVECLKKYPGWGPHYLAAHEGVEPYCFDLGRALEAVHDEYPVKACEAYRRLIRERDYIPPNSATVLEEACLAK